MRTLIKEFAAARHELIKCNNALYDTNHKDLWRLTVAASDILEQAIKLLNDRIPPWES